MQSAKEDNAVSEWSDSLSMLAQLVQDDQVALLLQDPRMNKGQQVEMLLTIGSDHLVDAAANLLNVMADYGRLELLPEVEQLFSEQKDKDEHSSTVEIISAYEIDAAMEKQIAKLLDGTKVTTKIDKSLIGGVVVRAGDLVIDASVIGRLQQLAVTLH